MAYPEPEERSSSSSSGPITQHRAFPAVVALWFAALLGLGSLVLPAVLLERLVGLSGLASVIPAAAPPLGLTARVLVALVAGLAGGALGLMLARRVAEASGVRRLPRRARGAGEARSPLNVLDELGDDRVTNGHAPPLSRRRAALMADGEPTLTVPAAAEHPTVDHEPLILSDLAAAQTVIPPKALPLAPPAVSIDEELSMTAEPFAFPRPHFIPALNPAAEDEGTQPAFTGAPTSEDEDLDDAPLSDGSLDAAPMDEPVEEPEMAEPAALKSVAADGADEDGPASWEDKPLEELGLVQLVQRLGSSLERRRAVLAQAAQRPVPMGLTPVEAADEAPVPSDAGAEPLAPAIVLPEAGIEAAPAEEAALARAAWFGAGAAAPAAAEANPADAVPEMAAPAVPSAPEPAPTPTTAVPGLRPAFLHGLAAASLGEQDEDEEPFPDFNLPLRATEEPAARAEQHGADGYRSLTAVNGSGSEEKKFVRFPGGESAPRPARLFDAPGSRPFGKSSQAQAGQSAPEPAAEPSDPVADTDAALRAALATLQRMSGPA